MANAQRWKGVRALPEDLEARLDALPAWLARHSVELAYLFGSAARKPAEAHDLDLALLRSVGPVYELRENLWGQLGSYRLDLVDLSRADPVLRFHVIRDGVLLYSSSDEVENEFELRTLHMYRDTAPLRSRQKEYFRERMSQWS